MKLLLYVQYLAACNAFLLEQLQHLDGTKPRTGVTVAAAALAHPEHINNMQAIADKADTIFAWLKEGKAMEAYQELNAMMDFSELEARLPSIPIRNADSVS